MSMPTAKHLAFAAGTGLTRHDCPQCREETLHRGSACIHCGHTRSLRIDAAETMRNSITRSTAVNKSRKKVRA